MTTRTFSTDHETKYLETLQQLINRMHTASQTSKQVCIGLVSALIAFAAATKNAHSSLIALLPIVVFWFLDAYYLSVERDFVGMYSRFVSALHAGDASSLVHRIDMGNKWMRPCKALRAALSFSEWPLYVALVACAVGVARFGDIIGFPANN